MNKNISKILQFADFDVFWQGYKPFTPYGRDHKRRMIFFNDESSLNKNFEIIEEFLTYIKLKTTNADRVEFYLKKIPEISLNDDFLDSTSIFLIKKFIINYKKIIKLLDSEILKSLNLDFELEELLDFLSVGQDKKETFTLSSKYDKRLEEIREIIFDFEKQLKQVKKIQLETIKEKTTLDFRFNSFLVLPEHKAVNINKDLIFLEPHDNKHLIAKPVLPKKYYSIKKDMDHYLELELKIQKEVLAEIGKKITAEKENLTKYIETIKNIDIYITKAQIALKYNMVKPQIKNNDNMEIKDAVFLPLKAKTESLGTTYYPLSVNFDTRVNVINGSNMGGKTILLKTISFLQILTQLGFYVPATKFSTQIFSNIFYIGDLENDSVSGLSSFGLEINSLVECLNTPNSGKVLYLLDEFARTTNSLEAKALLQAVLQEFILRNDILAFVSTHFVEIDRKDEIGYYNMKGLNYQEYLKYYNKDLNYSLHDRIILINKFMQYEIEKTTTIVHSYDALKIAQTLGLNKDIIDRAKKIL